MKKFCAVLMMVSGLMYTMNMSKASALNLLTNGDFEAGNTGFATEFQYSPGGIANEGTYDIVTDPHLVHGAAASYFDHTRSDGQGLMMALNGSTQGDRLIWSQTVAIASNQTYDFGLWYSSWYPESSAGIRVEINGVAVSSNLFAPGNTGVWESFTAQWQSGSSTEATIKLFNTTADALGNDFAIDDLSFEVAAVPEPTTLMLFGIGGMCGIVFMRKRSGRRN